MDEKDPFAPRDIKKLEESLFSDVKETDLETSFKPITSPLGITGSSYRLQLGTINDKLAIRLLKGKDSIDSHIFQEEDMSSTGFPNQNLIVG